MAELTRQDVIKLVAAAHNPIRLRGVDLSGLDLSYLDRATTIRNGLDDS